MTKNIAILHGKLFCNCMEWKKFHTKKYERKNVKRKAKTQFHTVSLRTFVIPFYYGPVPLRSIIQLRFRFRVPLRQKDPTVPISQHCFYDPVLFAVHIPKSWPGQCRSKSDTLSASLSRILPLSQKLKTVSLPSQDTSVECGVCSSMLVHSDMGPWQKLSLTRAFLTLLPNWSEPTRKKGSKRYDIQYESLCATVRGLQRDFVYWLMAPSHMSPNTGIGGEGSCGGLSQ